MALAGGLLGLAAGATLGALEPDSRGTRAGAGVEGPVLQDAAPRRGAPADGPPVEADASASVAAVIVPAAGLPVRDAGASGGGRR